VFIEYSSLADLRQFFVTIVVYAVCLLELMAELRKMRKENALMHASMRESMRRREAEEVFTNIRNEREYKKLLAASTSLTPSAGAAAGPRAAGSG
jgi:predicted Holliday junction resolvase-like endonuclease